MQRSGARGRRWGPTRRPAARALLRAALLVLLTSLLHLTSMPPSRADEDVGEVCWLGVEGYHCPSDEPDPSSAWAPAGLISPFVLARLPADQAQALLQMQEQAISNTLHDHGLPSSDRLAVQTWGRHDALAEFFALVVEAIKTDRPTSTQSSVVHWITERVRARQKGPGEHAGAQYVSWAGLDASTYWHLVNTGASQDQLRAFLSGTPRAYNTANIAAATSGWCRYRSPAPYTDEYTGDTSQMCYTPCSYFCSPPMPTYEQFVRWGQTVAQSGPRQDFLVNSAGIARAAIFGGVIGGAGLVAVPISVAVTVALSYLSVTVLPQLGAALTLEIVKDVVALSTRGWYAALPAYQAASTVFSASVAALAGSITVVLTAIMAAVLLGMQVVDQAAMPDKLANIVVESRKRPDVRTMLDNESGGALLYASFVGATLPSPRDDQRCDNSVIPDDAYAAGLDDVLVREQSYPYQWVVLDTRPCLNPSPVPAPSDADPRFVRRKRQDGPLASGVSTPEIAMRVAHDGQSLEVSEVVRMSGGWFVHHFKSLSGPETTEDQQSLEISYVDWEGEPKIAWLIGDGRSGFRFVGIGHPDDGAAVSLSTCREQAACWISTEIEYVGADDVQYAASVTAGPPA